MSPLELRASLGLASIFGLRLFGMFVILPVFAIYAEHLSGGTDMTLVGIAIGAYGLTQAILQIPFGWWSDRYGRKPVIYAGLALFAVGSFVAASAHSIHVVIVGRVLQGAGAISAAVMAMAADLTREEHRTKAMAMIGSTIGLTFALSLVASPWLNQLIGVPGIFAGTGVLALGAMLVIWRVIPDVAEARAAAPVRGFSAFASVLRDPQLARLNVGIFVLHAILMALFIVVPFSLRDAGMPLADHWKIYLPVMLGSFVIMVPVIMKHGDPVRTRRVFIGSVALILAAQLAFPLLHGSVAALCVFLLMFFTPFNILEAMLPSLTSRMAPVQSKGTAIGVYSSVQFFGTFVGAAGGGFLFGRFGAPGVVAFDAVMLALWLWAALGMRVPPMLRTREFPVDIPDAAAAEALARMLQNVPGVHEVHVAVESRVAYIKVDSRGFDEQNVRKLLAGEI